MMSEEWQKTNHESYGNNHVTWEAVSYDLLIAANFLEQNRTSFDMTTLRVGDAVPDQMRTLNVELLLKGSSIECLLKALYLKKGLGRLVENGGYKKIKNVGEHNLLDLVDQFEIVFSKEERLLLNRLTLFTKMGRYPVSKNWSDNKIQDIPGGGKGVKSFWCEPQDGELFAVIRQKILKELE